MWPCPEEECWSPSRRWREIAHAPGSYAYGSAKGGLSMFLEGLRAKLHARNVRVVTVKPGRVNTPMTAQLPASRLAVHPRVVASAIVRGFDVPRSPVYVPGIWRLVALVLRLVPETVMRWIARCS